MIPSRAFEGRMVAVFGLARTGLGAIRSLIAGGATVIAWDDNNTARDAGAAAGATIKPWREWVWEDITALVLSPGVPLTHPRPHEVVSHAHAAHVPVIGDVELFAREMRPQLDAPGRAPVIAITGTNGKSTTTALIGHILSACGFEPQVGGNIANRYWNWRRQLPRQSMCWRCPASRSICRPVWCRMSASCRISPPTISTATARWTITPRSRRG